MLSSLTSRRATGTAESGYELASLETPTDYTSALYRSIDKTKNSIAHAQSHQCPARARSGLSCGHQIRLTEAQTQLDNLSEQFSLLPSLTAEPSRLRKILHRTSGRRLYDEISPASLEKIERSAYRLSQLASDLPSDLGVGETAYLAHLALLERKDVPPTQADSILWAFTAHDEGERCWLKHRKLDDGRAALNSTKTLEYNCCPSLSVDDLKSENRKRARGMISQNQGRSERERELVNYAIIKSRGDGVMDGDGDGGEGGGGGGEFVLDMESDEEDEGRDLEAQMNAAAGASRSHGGMTVWGALDAVPRLP